MSFVNRQVLTLDEFTIQQLRAFPQATGELSSLLRDIGLAAGNLTRLESRQKAKETSRGPGATSRFVVRLSAATTPRT